MLTIHPLTFDRIVPVAANLCAADLRELDAAGIADATAMLRDALPLCSWAEDARWDGRSIAIYGVRPHNEAGVPWMLTTMHMEHAERAAVARASVRAVRRMQSEHALLVNWVHAENERAIRFIRWLGFKVNEIPAGNGGQFRKFHWSRAHV